VVTLKDLKAGDYEISLTKLIGKPIADVRGYLTAEFGEPIFKMTKVEFEDGTFLGCEGEHDLPYLVNWGRTEQPNYDAETLERLYDEDDDT